MQYLIIRLLTPQCFGTTWYLGNKQVYSGSVHSWTESESRACMAFDESSTTARTSYTSTWNHSITRVQPLPYKSADAACAKESMAVDFYNMAVSSKFHETPTVGLSQDYAQNAHVPSWYCMKYRQSFLPDGQNMFMHIINHHHRRTRLKVYQVITSAW